MGHYLSAPSHEEPSTQNKDHPTHLPAPTLHVNSADNDGRFFSMFRTWLMASTGDGRPPHPPSLEYFMPEYIKLRYKRSSGPGDDLNEDMRVAYFFFRAYIDVFDSCQEVSYLLE